VKKEKELEIEREQNQKSKRESLIDNLYTLFMFLGLIGFLVAYLYVDNIIIDMIAIPTIVIGGLSYIMIKNIFYVKRVSTFKEYRSKYMPMTIIGLIVLMGLLFAARNDIKDYPLYLRGELVKYTGTPSEINYHDTTGKGSSDYTEFNLDSGVSITWNGISEKFDPSDEYHFEYLPNSKKIIFITNVTENKKWRRN
jgi:hypothetical protein